MTTRKAMLTVASHAQDADDCRHLLDMLGLAPAKKRGHGDYRTYLKGCRCDACREAMRVYKVERRAEWRRDPSAADRVGHGKRTTYSEYGCRCAPCTAANTEGTRQQRARRRQRSALGQTGGGQ
ncbi:hypothetical protein ACH49_13470 [Streptomyces leeuwenhoekii]|uniref:Uncharacterized protein n=1 Tax=Streptomyces leeuwenhoekii TaxID=1437453 RepID=A0ABR5HZ86_STRLW|nr:hypothetical protein [Streptomyces leeuwenhoekii]KMS79065.1 hypothetical protein ACH49_13470 [Streptomyces leeuwenhoekii]